MAHTFCCLVIYYEDSLLQDLITLIIAPALSKPPATATTCGIFIISLNESPYVVRRIYNGTIHRATIGLMLHLQHCRPLIVDVHRLVYVAHQPYEAPDQYQNQYISPRNHFANFLNLWFQCYKACPMNPLDNPSGKCSIFIRTVPSFC